MSAAISPFTGDLLCTDHDRPQACEIVVDDVDDVDDAAAERAWADEIAERVVALWVGRAEVTPIPSTLREVDESSRRRRHLVTGVSH